MQVKTQGAGRQVYNGFITSDCDQSYRESSVSQNHFQRSALAEIQCEKVFLPHLGINCKQNKLAMLGMGSYLLTNVLIVG